MMMDICVYIIQKTKLRLRLYFFFGFVVLLQFLLVGPKLFNTESGLISAASKMENTYIFCRYIISIALHADTTVAQCVCLWHITRAANVRVEYAHLPSARPFSQLLINYSCLPQQWSRALSRCVCICISALRRLTHYVNYCFDAALTDAWSSIAHRPHTSKGLQIIWEIYLFRI